MIHQKMNGCQSTTPKKRAEKGKAVDAYLLTDMGNGQRYADDYRATVIHCHPWSKWLLWDGARWKIDDAGKAKSLAKKTILKMYQWAQREIVKLSKDESDEAQSRVGRIKALLAHAVKSQQIPRINAMLDLAKSEPDIPILPNALDRNPWLLNCNNGILSLRTGKLNSHDPQEYMTKLCPVTYDPSATCLRFERFLFEIFDGSDLLIAYLQRLVGYWLTGVTTEHILPVLHGSGANGKSVLMMVLLNLLGDEYSGKAPRDLLIANKTSQHPTALAWLHGKRFVAAVETAEGDRLDECLVKELTGGDKISARRMREDFWEFIPTHKVALTTNHKPNVRGSDYAIWRRLRLIPFGVTFPPEAQDKDLPAKLREELPGILNWALQGCLDWQQHGLQDPPEVLAATNEYRDEQDRLGEFLAQKCHVQKGNSDFRVKASDLYSDYREWCDANGERPANNIAFGMALGQRGIERDGGRRWYLGIALAAEAQ